MEGEANGYWPCFFLLPSKYACMYKVVGCSQRVRPFQFCFLPLFLRFCDPLRALPRVFRVIHAFFFFFFRFFCFFSIDEPYQQR